MIWIIGMIIAVLAFDIFTFIRDRKVYFIVYQGLFIVFLLTVLFFELSNGNS